MVTKYRDIAKAFTNEVMAVVDGDFQEALNFIRDMRSCVFSLIEKEKEKKVLEHPLVCAIHRKSYNEVLDMWGIICEKSIDNQEDFEQAMWNYDDGFAQQNEEIWCYEEVLDFIVVIHTHTDDGGYVDLVMLPNNVLMEIPSEYRYRLEV